MEVYRMKQTQAEQIRNKVLTILQDTDSDILEEIDDNIMGIKYIKLKNLLSREFTEGSVTGALNTITDRIDTIHKIKIKSGTYFYFSEAEDSFQLEDKSVDIIYSKELEEVLQYSQKIYDGISNILKNTAKDSYYSNVTTLDLDNLRKLLNNVSQTEYLLKDYKTNKAFENVEYQQRKNDYDDLPF